MNAEETPELLDFARGVPRDESQLQIAAHATCSSANGVSPALRFTHGGPTEKGKDIIFCVKNERITGRDSFEPGAAGSQRTGARERVGSSLTVAECAFHIDLEGVHSDVLPSGQVQPHDIHLRGSAARALCFGGAQ
jgi:hypothetical protein